MKRSESGLTLVELLVATTLLSIMALSFFSLTHASLRAWTHTENRDELTEAGRTALHRMTENLRNTNRVLLPFQLPTHVISTHHVLCVALGVDNDGDGLIDEDSYDVYHDGTAAGIPGIDDDQDGTIDEGPKSDDDESISFDEDPLDGYDNDGDGRIDEDWGPDMNGDGAPGVAWIDDDGDGQVDEGSAADDDEDGLVDEDPIEPIVYYVDGSSLPPCLVEEHPVDGKTVLAENLYYEDPDEYEEGFIVRRVVMRNGVHVVELHLRLMTGDGEVIEFKTTVAVRSCEMRPDWQTAGLGEIPL
ncbi:MAG: prepilin-type N-terminal cleavage/methylation domain-containing protein [Candidatus Eisenbacteria sp.]|nr:prepilin-type N-terminal cleavage/methylation domain-containing protein [Candidatus Eisenbacteria bacterium]